MTTKSLHVVPRGRRWAVRKTGSRRVTRLFDTRREAIEAARVIVRDKGGEVLIYGPDGRIRERDTYGENAFLPHG